MEIGSTEAEGNDQLIVNGTTLYQDNSIIEFAPTSSYTPSLNDVFEVTMPEVDWENVTFSSYYFTLQGYDGTNILLGVNPNAVPEPSTWALLVLGAAGLMYWRKRNS
ncbi:MAG: PEP-CTERM sorting domain-containing protein [Thermoguttaceae bacterium]|nr:PEP-CTERM sorting domain-containing protein [Thermoguttaceae bacterium]